MSKQQFHVNSSDRKQAMLEAAISVPTDGSIRVTVERLPKTRTARQNRALHLWCKQVSHELNERGLTIPVILEGAADVRWDSEGISFKKLVWCKVQEAANGEQSSANASTTDYPEVYDSINAWLATKGIHIPWPEEEK